MPPVGVPFALRGVKLWLGNVPGMLNDFLGEPPHPHNFRSWATVLSELRATGATHVTLQLSTGVMEFPTDNAYSDTLSYNPPLAGVEGLAAAIRGQGMTVGVSLFTNVANVITGTGEELDRPQPSNRAAWFVNHRARILEMAQFAESIGATSLILFQDEVQHLVRDPALTSDWIALIAAVRSVFGGSISSVLWTMGHGNSITSIPAPVLSQLDHLGLGFFPNLVRGDNPSISQLCQAYYLDADGHTPLAFIRQLSQTYGKPVWITDKAFHSFRGAAADEWRVFNPDIPLIPDESEQANLYESFLSVMSVEGRGWLHGASFQSFSNIVSGAFPIARFVSGPVSESPQGKLAESVLTDWFNGRRRSSCPIL
jgi:hypothetical protein